MLLLCLGLATSLAACGSDDNEDSNGGSSSSATETTASEGGGAGLEAAQALVDEASAAPEGVGYDIPLEGEIPSGKTIAILEVPTPVAQQVNKYRTESHDALGWKTEIITVGPNPEDPGKAFQQAIDAGVDGIWHGGYPTEAIAAQLKAADEAGIPVVGESLNDETTPPFIAITRDRQDIDHIADVSAAKVAVDSGGKAEVQLFGVSTFPTLAGYNDSFKEHLAEYCPDCKVEVNEVDFAEVGKGLPGQVVSAVQRNPDTNWVIFAFGDASIGVEEALKSAGVRDQVQVGGAIPGPAQLEALKAGTDAFWMADVSVESMPYRETDLFARHFAGQTDAVSEIDDTPMVSQLFTPDNIGEASIDADGWWTGFPGTVDAYKKMWGIG